MSVVIDGKIAKSMTIEISRTQINCVVYLFAIFYLCLTKARKIINKCRISCGSWQPAKLCRYAERLCRALFHGNLTGVSAAPQIKKKKKNLTKNCWPATAEPGNILGKKQNKKQTQSAAIYDSAAAITSSLKQEWLLRQLRWGVASFVTETATNWSVWLCTNAAPMCARYASPQIEDVISTGEGRMGLLGDWREVSPSPSLSVRWCLFWRPLCLWPCRLYPVTDRSD